MSGWFVRNLREVQWHEGVCGAYSDLEEGDRFPEIGLGAGMLMSGHSSKEAYAGLPPDGPVPFRDEFLPSY
jgi:hypothetical protein